MPPWTWTGLHLDGVLQPLWRDTSHAVDAVIDPALRARAFAPLVPARAAVGRLSAVWVHAGGTPPGRLVVLVGSGVRRPEPHPDRFTAEADLLGSDVDVVAGVRVTTLTRTAVDVARWEPASTAMPALRALVDAGLRPGRALQRLELSAGGRGVRTARQLLRAV